MKKIQKKDALRNIRKRIVSYLSICLVIMLGLGGVFVTRYLCAGLNAETARVYNSHGFKNYELISSLGITDEDLAQIRETEGVTDAEGVIRAAGSLTKGDTIVTADLLSMTERISAPEVIEGRAPVAKDECMIAEDLAETKGFKVGDRVRIVMEDIASPVASPEDETDEDADEKGSGKALFEEEFTVTGLMVHPDYLRRKSVEYVVLPWSAFDQDVTDGYYTHAFVKAEDPEGVDLFSKKYFEETADTKQALEELTDTLAVDSVQRAKDKAYARIDEEWQKALKDLENAQNEIDDNEANLTSELAKARKELQDAQKELDNKVADANKQIRDAEKKIADGEKRIKDGEKKIKDGEKKIADGEKQIKDGEKQLKESREYLELADKYLPDAEKYVEETKKIREGELKEAYDTLKYAQTIIDALNKIEDKNSQEYKDKVLELAKYISDHQAALLLAHEYFQKDEVMKAAEKVTDVTKIDAVGAATKVRDFDLPALLRFSGEIQKNGGDYDKFVADTTEYIEGVNEELRMLEEAEKYINEYKASRGDLYKELENKEKELENGKRELAAAKQELENGKKELAASKDELAAAKKKLADSKAELAGEKKKYEAKIRDGWSVYFSKKADYETKLEEAKALLAENREAAEEKLAEARAEVEKIDGKWLVFDRRANAGYVDISSTLSALNSAGVIFGILFMLISAVVCFSTLTIIIEEQKKMVGTVKAFGFHKREILGKYLVFGVTAAVIGCIAGIILALVLSGIVLKAYYESGMYLLGLAKSVVTPGPTVIFCLIMIVICAIATVIACTDILKSPASILMKGGSSKKKDSGYRKTSSSRRGGSLYSRLILRNMSDDKVRVAISIIIIMFSTLLVGAGLSMKFGYDKMTTKQIAEVNKYDVRVDLGGKITEADKRVMEDTMTQDGAEYIRASYESHIFHLGDRLDALNVLTAEPDGLDEYFGVRDPKTGEILELPEDGVLVQRKIKESYGKDIGSTITILNSELDECEAEVKGVFQNYVGRTVITTPEGYRSIFGEDPEFNCYYVKAGGADIEKLKEELASVNGDVSFEASNDFAVKFVSVSFMYNIIVYVTTGIAILMSVMILSNLANIFLNRKKTELTVMRINGFSIKQTKGYLSRETIVTTAAGVILGLIAGAIVTPFLIKAMEQPDLQFIRSFHTIAWVAAVAIEVVFSVIINSLVFRKVKDLNFRDVA